MDQVDGVGAAGLSEMIVQSYLAKAPQRTPPEAGDTGSFPVASPKGAQGGPSEGGSGARGEGQSRAQTGVPSGAQQGAQAGAQSGAQAGNLFLSQVDLETDASGLTEDEKAVVEQLKARDKEVRNHEEAHARVGGQYAGAPSYTFQPGPDGQQYAIGGEVPIDVAPVADDPEATIEKMDVVKAAALAPAEPSAQDRKVAALADAQRTQAIGDLAQLRQAVNQGEVEPGVDTAI